jgi:hypothetical protein
MTTPTRSLNDEDTFFFNCAYLAIFYALYWSARHRPDGAHSIFLTAFFAVLTVHGSMLFARRNFAGRAIWLARIWIVMWIGVAAATAVFS